MYGALLSLLGGLAQQPGQTQQSNALDRRRQYFQQLMGGQQPAAMPFQSRGMQGQGMDIGGLLSILQGSQSSLYGNPEMPPSYDGRFSGYRM